MIDVIREIEERFPVETWSVDGLAVWPLVRIKLDINYFCSLAQGLSPAGSLAQMARGWLGFVTASWRDRRANARLEGPVDALFLGHGHFYVERNGLKYERFCDPLIERLARRGIRSLLLAPTHHYLIPRHTPSLWVQPALDAAHAYSRLQWKLRPKAPALPGHSEIRELLRTRGLDPDFLISPRIVQRLAYKVEAQARIFGAILKKVRPKIGFCVPYYGHDGMSFILACRRHGVPAVDIQHGCAGEASVAYGQWGRLPSVGYDLLPDVFWCWDQRDKSAVERWAGRFTRHRAILGGNPYLEQFRRERKSGPLTEQDRPLRILVSLQPGMTGPEHLSSVLEAVRQTPDWVWLFRVHPSDASGRKILRHILAPFGQAELEHASEVALYELLSEVDVHVTSSSAVVHEARWFGVPSVVIHPRGAELYQEYFDDGWVLLAETEAALRHAIIQQASRRQHLPLMAEVTELDERDPLDALFGGRSQPALRRSG